MADISCYRADPPPIEAWERIMADPAYNSAGARSLFLAHGATLTVALSQMSRSFAPSTKICIYPI
jgi:hypothetical protein